MGCVFWLEILVFLFSIEYKTHEGCGSKQISYFLMSYLGLCLSVDAGC